ncbi:MAG UNVERIFIED_CONTAM: hypothetical protein LVR29_11050 [Microcystis novacekii LVE1205-3]
MEPEVLKPEAFGALGSLILPLPWLPSLAMANFRLPEPDPWPGFHGPAEPSFEARTHAHEIFQISPDLAFCLRRPYFSIENFLQNRVANFVAHFLCNFRNFVCISDENQLPRGTLATRFSLFSARSMWILNWPKGSNLYQNPELGPIPQVDILSEASLLSYS